MVIFLDTKWLTELGKSIRTLGCCTDSYNIFQVLEIESKEVLICRFLGDLLDPNGSHGCKIEFLKRFLKLLKAEEVSDAELINAKVVLEEHTDNNRRIDIVIHLSTEVYPIEVKIWAGDQDEQLYDYWEYCKNLNATKIYYLTPTGWSPSENSIKGLQKDFVKCLSFQDDIRSWLGGCLKDEICKPGVQEIVKQFKEVIDRMCESAEEWKVIEKSVFEDRDPDKLRAVFGIIENADRIQKRFQEDFIRNHIELPDGWKFAELQDDEKKKYKDAILKVVSEKSKNVLGYICITANLYIYATENVQCIGIGEWTLEQTDDFPWRYLTPPDNKPINLRNPLDVKNSIDVFAPDSVKIKLGGYLKEA